MKLSKAQVKELGILLGNAISSEQDTNSPQNPQYRLGRSQMAKEILSLLIKE